MADGFDRWIPDAAPRAGGSGGHRRAGYYSPAAPIPLGKHSRFGCRSSGNAPVPAADLDNIPPQTCRQSEHPHDVHANAGGVRLRRQPIRPPRMGRLELLGDLRDDRVNAGRAARDGYLLRAAPAARRSA